MTSLLEQEIFDQFPCPIVVAKTNMEVQFMNTSALSLIGHQPDLSRVFSSEDGVNWSQYISGGGEGEMELQLGMPKKLTFCVRRSGDEVLLIASQMISSSDLGDFICDMLGRFHAIDSRLNYQEERLEVCNGLITHDAANIVTAVYGYLQMLSSDGLSKKARQYVDATLLQTEALIRLIDNTRVLRIMELHPSTDVEPIELLQVIKGCIRSIIEIYSEEEHRIINNIPEGEYWVSAEPMVREIFLNLLDNAMRYGDHHPIILEMKLSDDKKMWHFRIIDEGRGIPDDMKEYLFVRFDRLNEEKKIKGGGLGLSVVRALASRYNSQVWVEDRVPGVSSKGSIFNVTFPRIDQVGQGRSHGP